MPRKPTKPQNLSPKEKLRGGFHLALTEFYWSLVDRGMGEAEAMEKTTEVEKEAASLLGLKLSEGGRKERKK